MITDTSIIILIFYVALKITLARIVILGKTCGFLLPAFHRMLTYLKDRRRGPPGILVLAPTRELACQIEEECVKFGRSSNIRSVCAYGGAPKSLQVRKIQGGIEVLIATPGRLNDLLEMRVVDLTQVVFLGKLIVIHSSIPCIQHHIA